jgi:hypothetical protein
MYKSSSTMMVSGVRIQPCDVYTFDGRRKTVTSGSGKLRGVSERLHFDISTGFRVVGLDRVAC